MKKIITIVSLLFCCISSKAQEGISFGIKGGLNTSYLKGVDLDSLSDGGAAKNSNGIVFGITLNNRLSHHFWLKHELFYQKSAVTIQMDDDLHGPFSSKLKRDYIDLFPISPTYQYKGFQVYAGPYIAWLLNASIQRKDADGKLYTDRSFFGRSDLEGNYSHKFDAGLVAGIEYELPGGINIGTRFMRGFVPIIEHTANQNQWRIYNQTMFFTIGYSFH